MKTFKIAAAVLVAALLAACAKAPASPVPTVPATTVPAAPATTTAKPAPTPAKPTGTLRVALSSFVSEQFGPKGGSAMAAVDGLFEQLVEVNEKGQIVGVLAERWESSPDAKTWTFYLRKGVQFHDGWGEFTAEDVKFTYELGGQKDSLTTLFRTHGSLLESLQVVDPYQVRFNFKNPYPFMAAELAVRSGDPFIHSKKYTEAVGAESAAKKPVGTGPFKFVEHKLGDSVRLEALPSHWRQTAGFQYLIYKLVPAAATAVQMLKAGDIDVAAIDTGNIDELKASGFTFLRGADSYGYYVGLGGQIQQSKYPQIFDPKIPWVGDPSNPASIQNAFKVRQALALAVDKESIVRNIFKGAASANAVSTYEAGRPWTDSKWKPVPYDVTKAKQLLTEAGYPNGLEFPLYTYPMAGRPDIPTMAEAVAMMWQQIGVKTSIRLTDSGSFKPNFQKDRKLGFAAFTETVSRKDTEPTIHFSTYFNSGGTYYNGIEDARLDDLQKRIMSETDPAKRYELEKQRGQLFVENNWVIFIADKGTVFAVGPKVAQLTPDWSGNGSRPAYQYALPK